MAKMCMRCGYKVSDDAEKCPLCDVDFDEIVPEKLGRFGNGSKQRKIQKQFEDNYGVKIDELKKDLIKKTFFEKNNIFERVTIGFTSPEKDIIIKQHNALTKSVATLGLGLVGLAATSGVKFESKQKFIKKDLQVVDEGIVIKKASKDNKDVRIPFDNIKNIHKVGNSFKLVLLENQTFSFLLYVKFNPKQKEEMLKFVPELEKQFIDTINEKAKGNENPDEIKWENTIDKPKQTTEPKETKQESNSLMDELERLGNMYEKGLLTDEEFAALKKKLINGD